MEEQKCSGEFTVQAFTEPKMQNVPSSGHHGVASKIYWLHYKPPVLSCTEVGTHVFELPHKLLNALGLKMLTALSRLGGLTCPHKKTKT